MSAMMFRAIVWKEVRENLKWAVAILLCMSIVLAVAIPSLDTMNLGRGSELAAITKAFDAVTAIGGLLAGLLIGASQSLLENRGDKWGFLAHRPVSRTTLFWGKASAGILLYVLSTGVPVAVALLRVAAPGYMPIPFDWRIGLPATANLLCGLVFYFAGFLTGMREARWYASRTLGICAAACCLFLQLAVAREFWQAIVANAAGLIIVGTAAWGTFVAGGQYGAQPRSGRIATGVSIGLGIAVVGWLVFVLNAVSLVLDPSPRSSRFTRYTVTREGEFAAIAHDGNLIVGVSDLAGRRLEQYRNATHDEIRSPGILSATLAYGAESAPSFRATSRLFIQLRRTTMVDPLSWYYVDRLGLIAAHDIASRKLVGWMGPDGFSQGEARPRPFTGKLKLSSGVLVFEDAVYRLDLDNRLVEKIFQRVPGESILGAVARAEDFEAIATTQRVVIQHRDGTRLLEAPQDANTREFSILQVMLAPQAPGNPTFLWYQDLENGEGRVYKFDSAGAVVNSWTLPPWNGMPEYSRLGIAVVSAMSPLISLVSTRDLRQLPQSSSFWPDRTTSTYWSVAILSSIIFAAAAFLHGRRYAFPTARLGTWTGISLLLGPLGYLLMLALLEWPAREPCPACNRKRVVTRERCEHCGEPFAVPPKDGTEIFEPMIPGR